MERTIKAFSIYQAFQFLLKDLKEEGVNAPSSFMNIDEIIPIREGEVGPVRDEDGHDEIIDFCKKYGLSAGYCIEDPTENPNQIQTRVIDTIIKGDKKWKTQYLAIYDTPWGDQVVPGSKSITKKECVDKAREAGSKENRDTFVLIGKSTSGFPRCQAQILYKPSPKQKPGMYCFIW